MSQNPWGIKEKQLEDWICENPEEMFWDGFQIVARQIPLNHGKLDILAYDERIFIVELKARPLIEKDIGQILRYVYDVSMVIRKICNDLYSVPRYQLTDYLPQTFKSVQEAECYRDLCYRHCQGLEDKRNLGPPLVPVLIGTQTDSKVRAATLGGEIEVMFWAFEPNKGIYKVRSTGMLIYSSEVPTWAKKLNALILQNWKRRLPDGTINYQYLVAN